MHQDHLFVMSKVKIPLMRLQHFVTQLIQDIDNTFVPENPDPPRNRAILAGAVGIISALLLGIAFFLFMNAVFVWIQSLNIPETPTH